MCPTAGTIAARSHRVASTAVTRAIAAFRIDSFLEEDPYLSDGDLAYRRARLTKTFTGDLEGESAVEMLSVRSDGPGAGYVALERFDGTLAGRRGSFALLHAGTMDDEAMWGDWRVVPGSGTGQLTGLAGVARIEITAEGDHSLHLDYELAAAGA